MMNQGSGEQGSVLMASTQIYDGLWLGLDIEPSPGKNYIPLETIVDVGNFHIP